VVHLCFTLQYGMHYIQERESDEVSSDGNAVPSSSPEVMGVRTVRQVYLLTYSQANLQRFPTRKSFADAVMNSFEERPANIMHWVCSREQHQNGGHHYHMALKLDRAQRWLSVKCTLEEDYGIVVHFSSIHYNYYSAWKYVTKADEEFIESDNHPDLRNGSSPRTSTASIQRRMTSNYNRSEDEEQENPSRRQKRKRKLSAFDLSEIIVQKGIKTRTELLALAQLQKEEGKVDVAEFIINRGTRAVADVLHTAWELSTAPQSLERQKKTRLQLIHEALHSNCVCNGLWFECATQILQRNGIVHQAFSDAVKDLLQRGRGKLRNILIVGPANCGKTFLLNPLTIIYETFRNPATSTFAWVGAESAECIFLNDFRWSHQLITWHDFLLMLEGQMVHLPAPKTHYAKDMVFEKDTPIFCTSKHQFIFVKNGVIDDRETEMMCIRWKVFTLNYQIPADEQRYVPSCSKCFARFIL